MSAESSTAPVIEALDVTHAKTLIMEALARGVLQIGKPLSVSIAGRSVSYGSAAEAFMAMETMLRVDAKLDEQIVRRRPFSVSQVIRG